MCILFTNINQHPNSDEYKLILANVRDEFYSRPTQICSFWDNDTDLIGGRDLERGGTWLAMNKKNGKIGVLLNILQPNDDIKGDKKSRGALIVDYLKSDRSPESYLNLISEDVDSYNGYLMIAMKVNSDIKGSYFSNFYKLDPLPLSSGVHAFGNNLYPHQMWPKVCFGKKKFEDIVSKYNIKEKEKLIKEIFHLFSDKTIHPLDDQIKIQGKGKPLQILEKLNSIHVQIPQVNYGSRTWTVILIDANGNVDFIERTMKEPININGKVELINTKNTFKLDK